MTKKESKKTSQSSKKKVTKNSQTPTSKKSEISQRKSSRGGYLPYDLGNRCKEGEKEVYRYVPENGRTFVKCEKSFCSIQ